MYEAAGRCTACDLAAADPCQPVSVVDFPPTATSRHKDIVDVAAGLGGSLFLDDQSRFG